MHNNNNTAGLFYKAELEYINNISEIIISEEIIYSSEYINFIKDIIKEISPNSLILKIDDDHECLFLDGPIKPSQASKPIAMFYRAIKQDISISKDIKLYQNIFLKSCFTLGLSPNKFIQRLKEII